MKKFLYIASFALLFSCRGEVAEKPDNLLPEGKMVDMLYDITILQAINSFTPQVLDRNKVQAKNYLFKKYKTDSLTFARSHEFYASDLDLYEGIQKKVAARIEKDKVKYGIKKKEDTINPTGKSDSSGPKIRPRTRTIKTDVNKTD